jgi:hypothetical protein
MDSFIALFFKIVMSTFILKTVYLGVDIEPARLGSTELELARLAREPEQKIVYMYIYNNIINC